MKILIFGGTTEGRELSVRLQALGAEVIVCVASDYGFEEQSRVPGVRTLVGPLSAAEKQHYIADAALCIDATHPYASHISVSVREACEAAGVPCYRLLRGSIPAKNAVYAESPEDAAAYLASRSGNVLLTTGARHLTAYAILNPDRLFPRVLPSHEALTACEACRIPHRNIIAMQGPFTQELNEALMRQYQIRFLVTKDSGDAGGFSQKAAAAESCSVELIVLRRPQESGYSFEEVLQICKSSIGC